MKQLFSIALLLCIVNGLAQSFHRGSVILQVGTGLEFYQTKKTYNGAGVIGDTSSIGQAAGGNLNACLEIGISKRVGIGARGKMNSFFSDIDAVLAEKTQVRTAELLLGINWHPIRRKRFDLLLGAEGGFSSVNVTFQNISDMFTSGKGPAGAIYLEPRFYKKRFGFHIRFTLPFTQYKTLSTIGSQATSQQYSLNTWQGRGYGINAGVQLRIF